MKEAQCRESKKVWASLPDGPEKAGAVEVNRMLGAEMALMREIGRMIRGMAWDSDIDPLVAG